MTALPVFFDDKNAPPLFDLPAMGAPASGREWRLRQAAAGLARLHVGGEVRPHTQEFIDLAARLYAAHGLEVHLRPADEPTTPIWLSSFGVFFDELEIPRPAIHLEIGSGTHGAQTGRMLEAVERALQDTMPDMVIVYGDTNSTAAGALAAAKLHIPIAHIEAGLRSFNRAMPEEVNRVVADHVSDLLLAPTRTAMKNLAAENLGSRAIENGDVMLDAVRFNVSLAQRESQILDRLEAEPGRFGVVTMHRATASLASLRISTLKRIS